MISSVSGGVAATSMNAALAGVQTSAASATQPMTVGAQTPVTPAEAGLGDLTAADWKLVSASVGSNVGPDASGKIQPLQPALALAIESMRQSGSLAPGQELTLGDMKKMAIGQQSSGFEGQIQNAISYLEENLQTSLGSSTGQTINIKA